jgi:hypothetical protein
MIYFKIILNCADYADNHAILIGFWYKHFSVWLKTGYIFWYFDRTRLNHEIGARKQTL